MKGVSTQAKGDLQFLINYRKVNSYKKITFSTSVK